MPTALISSPAGIIAVLAAICSLFFFLEKKTESKLFSYLPPLIFIYVIPVALSNTGIIPSKSGVYDFMGDSVLPMFLTIMLLNVNVAGAIKVMGRGVFVMLLGTLGVVIGAPIAFAIVSSQLGPEAWKGFGALAGSWIGGTGNMLAVAQMVQLDESLPDFAYAVVSDNAVYLIWLPIMLGSRNLAEWFHRFTKVPADRLTKIEDAAKELTRDKGKVEMRHLLYLICFGAAVTALATWLSGYVPPVSEHALSSLIPGFIKDWFGMSDGTSQTIISQSTYRILLVTVMGLVLSFTRARNIPGSHALSMALIYLFVARMGAKADLSGIDSSMLYFIGGAFIWIFIHGGFLLGAARLFKVDVHTAAIASAANIGGAASAPIVAAHHKPALVPVSILMALLGYAIGNPAAYIAALLCSFVS